LSPFSAYRFLRRGQPVGLAREDDIDLQPVCAHCAAAIAKTLRKII